jgi:hypothetical protein
LDKDSGIFASKYVLYKTNHAILQDGSEYKIIVTDNSTGVTASSRTKVVFDPQVYPIAGNDSINFLSTGSDEFPVIFKPKSNSFFYEMIVRFNYRDIDTTSGITEQKKIDWYFSSPSVITSDQDIIFQFYFKDLLTHIGTNIPDNPSHIRRIDSLINAKPFEIMILVGSEDLSTYIKLQKLSTGNIQDKPLFTTVENGLGLFTSRIIHTISRYPNYSTQNAFDTSAATMLKKFRFD